MELYDQTKQINAELINLLFLTDLRHFDYFFNRCMSLIALALQYVR